MTFGLQSFVSISLMRLMMKKKLAQAPPELVDTQIAFKNAIVANRNLAGLLRNDDGDGI